MENQLIPEHQALVAQCAKGELSIYELAEKIGCTEEQAAKLTREEMRRQMLEQVQRDKV